MPELVFEIDMLDKDDLSYMRTAAIDLSGAMLFPRDKDIKKLLNYKAMYLMDTVGHFVNKCGMERRLAGEYLVNYAIEMFRGWDNFLASLINVKLPEKGKGSPQSIAQHGYLTGIIFRRVLFEDESLSKASDFIINNADAIGMLSDVGYSKENIINNIWPAYKHVAHVWAAMLEFELPESVDKYIRLDLAKSRSKGVPHGVSGILQLAKALYDKAVNDDVTFKKTNKKLVEVDKSWKIVLDGL